MNNIIEERYTEIAMIRLIFGSDHAGYRLKKYLTSEILTTGVEVQDMVVILKKDVIILILQKW